MTITIHLLYVDDCPNVEAARQNLREALDWLGQPHRWTEMNIGDVATPQAWEGFPSPTILVNGMDVVTGEKSAKDAGACRLGSAPSTEVITTALKSSKGLWTLFAAIPAVAMGFLPSIVCPACIPALAGLLSAIGVGGIVAVAVVKPLTILFLLVALFGLLYQAKRNHRYGPVAVGSLGAAGLYTALCWMPIPPFKWLGALLLISASIWNVLPTRKKADGATCPACQGEGGVSHG